MCERITVTKPKLNPIGIKVELNNNTKLIPVITIPMINNVLFTKAF